MKSTTGNWAALPGVPPLLSLLGLMMAWQVASQLAAIEGLPPVTRVLAALPGIIFQKETLFDVGASLQRMALGFGLALLFAVFGARTALRHRTVVEVDDIKVATHGLWRQEMKWSELIEVKLNYYSTKRDRTSGWMQLMLRGPTGKLRFDSTLDGFPEVARRAHMTARAKGIELTEATISNFASLGFEPAKSKD